MRDTIEAACLSLAVLVLCAACITLQPTDQTVQEGESAAFTVGTSGAGVTTYQWERSDDNGTTWAAIGGATSPSYLTPPTTVADDGARFRVVVTDDDGVATSAAATLTVEPSYGGWWEVYRDDGVTLEPLIALEFQHTGTTVRYLNIVMTLAGGAIYGLNDGGLGFDLTVVDHDNLQGALIINGTPVDVALIRCDPSGAQSAQGDFEFVSATSYGCVEADASDVYFASVDHMGCDRSVMLEIDAWPAPLLPGSHVVGDEVDVSIHVEEIVGGQYVYSSYVAVGGSITLTIIDTTRVAGTYAIVTAPGETITGSFDVPVFVTWR